VFIHPNMATVIKKKKTAVINTKRNLLHLPKLCFIFWYNFISNICKTTSSTFQASLQKKNLEWWRRVGVKITHHRIHSRFRVGLDGRGVNQVQLFQTVEKRNVRAANRSESIRIIERRAWAEKVFHTDSRVWLFNLPLDLVHIYNKNCHRAKLSPAVPPAHTQICRLPAHAAGRARCHPATSRLDAARPPTSSPTDDQQ
jgi:hypothetical protein